MCSPFVAPKWCPASDCPPDRVQFRIGLGLIDVFDPVCRCRYGPIVKEVVSAEITTSPKTGPTPVFGTWYQARTKGVPLNVSTNAKDVRVSFDRDRLVAPLVHRTRARRASDGMPSLGMSACEPVHEPGKVPGSSRPDDQMPVVGHGAICQDTKRDSLHGLQQHSFERSVVGWRFEQQSAPNPAIENVIDRIGRRPAWTSGHLNPVNVHRQPQMKCHQK